MELDPSGKVARLTGANRGIGTAVAAKLASEGMHLCPVARESAKLREVADGLEKAANTAVLVISADLRDPAAPWRAIAEAVAHHRRLDLLVNNAGATKRADFFTLKEEDWQDGFAWKFHGYVRMTREAWPHLRSTKGSIVNIVGIGSRAGAAGFYHRRIGQCRITEFYQGNGGYRHTPRCSGQCHQPWTDRNRAVWAQHRTLMRERSLSHSDATSFLISSHATTRIGHPAEIGSLVAYPASSKADFILGSIIDIDGGANRCL